VPITNLAFHDLVTKIVQNLFFCILYVSHINIMHWKHIWHTNLLEDAKFMWHLFIHRFILRSQHIYCVLNMFSTHDIHVLNVQTYEWMNFAWFSLLIRHLLNLWFSVWMYRCSINILEVETPLSIITFSVTKEAGILQR